MTASVESGVLRGRPFGGLMTLVSNKYQQYCHVVCALERVVIVAVGNLLVINVYLPCSGTNDRLDICEDILDTIYHGLISTRITSILLEAISTSILMCLVQYLS